MIKKSNENYYTIGEIMVAVLQVGIEVRKDSEACKDIEDVLYGIEVMEKAILARLNAMQ